MTLDACKAGEFGIIKRIRGDEKTKKFLFSLGCAEGDPIALISVLGDNYIVNIKDSRFALDRALAGQISVTKCL